MLSNIYAYIYVSVLVRCLAEWGSEKFIPQVLCLSLDMTMCWSGNCRGKFGAFCLFKLQWGHLGPFSLICRLVSKILVLSKMQSLFYISLVLPIYLPVCLSTRMVVGIRSPMTLMICLKSLSHSIGGAPERRPQGKVSECRNASWTPWLFICGHWVLVNVSCATVNTINDCSGPSVRAKWERFICI